MLPLSVVQKIIKNIIIVTQGEIIILSVMVAPSTSLSHYHLSFVAIVGLWVGERGQRWSL
jgi:hypothetical protein